MKMLFPISLLLLGSFLIITSCNKSVGRVTYKNKSFTKKYITPPGTVRIGENFFSDESEITNIDYKEYLVWTKKVLGDSIYQLILPDTLVWELEDGFNEPFVTTYFQHPAYDMYPVVGVSHEQAMDYLKWRSDRVYEMLLISEDIIAPNYEQSIEMHFTIENYLSGNYLNYVPDTTFLPSVPIYRLPSKEEWEFLASSGLNISEYPYGYNTASGRVHKVLNKKKNRNTKIFNLKYPNISDAGQLNIAARITAPSRSFLPNDFGLYHTIGNVAEMTASPGIAKGGSFLHEVSESGIVDQVEYSKPMRWLGFRGVCNWEPVSKYAERPIQ